jgi:hypothetical protein
MIGSRGVAIRGQSDIVKAPAVGLGISECTLDTIQQCFRLPMFGGTGADQAQSGRSLRVPLDTRRCRPQDSHSVPPWALDFSTIALQFLLRQFERGNVVLFAGRVLRRCAKCLGPGAPLGTQSAGPTMGMISPLSTRKRGGAGRAGRAAGAPSPLGGRRGDDGAALRPGRRATARRPVSAALPAAQGAPTGRRRPRLSAACSPARGEAPGPPAPIPGALAGRSAVSYHCGQATMTTRPLGGYQALQTGGGRQETCFGAPTFSS